MNQIFSMKRIYLFVLPLIATANISKAQNYDMFVEKINGEIIKYKVENIEKVTIAERPDPNEGWTSLGYCLYSEDFIGSTLYTNTLGDLCCEYYVEVQESDEQAGLYRLVNPYGPEVYPYTSKTTYDTEENYYLEINATDPDGVYIEYQDMGLTWGRYGRFYVYSYAARNHDLGNSWETIKNAGYCGTLKDGVITFPESRLLTQFPAYSSGYFSANTNNKFKLDTSDKSEKIGSRGVESMNTEDCSIDLNNLLTVEEIANLKRD